MLKIKFKKTIIMLDQLTSQEISKITDSSDFFSLSKLTEVKVSRSDECNCACIPFSSIAIGHENLRNIMHIKLEFYGTHTRCAVVA